MSYVITRYDANALRSVPIAGKCFDDMKEATAEAARLNSQSRYATQFLMVDLASAFRPSAAGKPANRVRRGHHRSKSQMPA